MSARRCCVMLLSPSFSLQTEDNITISFSFHSVHPQISNGIFVCCQNRVQLTPPFPSSSHLISSIAALSKGRLPPARQPQYPHHRQQQPLQQFGAGNQQQQQQHLEPQASVQQQQSYPAELRMEGDLIVQALNGFLLILTCDGEVFYTSHTVETYLGFHQSDICHQSVYELVHSEDREELMQQLKWNSMIPDAGSSSGGNPLQLADGSSSDIDRQVGGGVGGCEQASKNASQMSLNEILASAYIAEHTFVHLQALELTISNPTQPNAHTHTHKTDRAAEHRHLLERNFTVRFRCLLDNTSGFLRLDIRGRIKVLHGQQNQHNLANSPQTNPACNKKLAGDASIQQQQHQVQREPMLAFFGVCIPFGPPSLLEMPSKDSVFKSKHRLDLSLINMDPRGKQLLGLHDLTNVLEQNTKPSTAAASLNSSSTSPSVEPKSPKQLASATITAASGSTTQVKLENGTGKASGQVSNAVKQKQNISAYDLVHHDDLSYMASAHQELLKTGASGLIAYRMISQPEGKHQWLQTSAKLYYKNSKPDFILCTHRPLMEEEGRDLLGKRTMDFKVTYLDVGLNTVSDRMMLCDKFSTSQQQAVSKSPALKQSSAAGNSNGTSNVARFSTSSPIISGESSSSSVASSSRSVASISPEANIDRVSKGVKRKGYGDSNNGSNFDLTAANLHSDPYDYATGDYELGHYKMNRIPGNNGTYYDMDTRIESAIESNTRSRTVSDYTKAKKGVKMSATNKQASKKGSDMIDQDHRKRATNRTGLDSNDSTAAATAAAAAAAAAAATMHHHHHQGVSADQQLQLYSQYTSNHQSHHHPHSHLEHANQAVVADTFPAFQAAAVYAAGVQHQYGTSHAAMSHYNTHHHHPAQSLYGTSMVSPTSAMGSYAAAAQHHHHRHQAVHHLHSLESYHHPQAHQHYGTGGATSGSNQTSSGAQTYASGAANSSFLPSERLLHHYSQSARSAAALAANAWPTTASSTANTAGAHQTSGPATIADYSTSTNGAYSGTQAGASWNASAAAMAAVALAASTSGSSAEGSGLVGQQQQQSTAFQPLYHQQSPTIDSISPKTASSLSGAASSSSPTVQRPYSNSQQASLVGNKTSNQHGPASLSSDGSAHRSPLSSSESSNGSGCLVAANGSSSTLKAASTLNATSAVTNGLLTSSSCYLTGNLNNSYYTQQQNQQNQHHFHQQHLQSSSYQHQQAHHNQHQLVYANDTMPYGSQQQSTHQQYQQQQSGDLDGSQNQAASSYHASYTQVASTGANDLTASLGANGSSSQLAARAAVKLYGSAGNGNNQNNNDQATTFNESDQHYYMQQGNYQQSTLVYTNLDNTINQWPIHGDSTGSDKTGTDNRWNTTSSMPQRQLESLDNGPTLCGPHQDDKHRQPLETCKNLRGTGSDNMEEVQEDPADANDQRDPLARLISSTIGDMMLDIAPKREQQH